MGLQLIPPDIDIDFVGKRYFFIALSTIINIVAIVLLLVVGLNYGVDFAGGSVVQLKFDRPTNGEEIRKALSPMDLGEISVQEFGAKDQNQFLVRFEKVKNIGSLGKELENAAPVQRHAAAVEGLQILDGHRFALLVGHRLLGQCHSAQYRPDLRGCQGVSDGRPGRR